ncbi:MAG: replication initiator protein A [Rhodopila sp.]|nr:replication initiator protein A [Rhodopila sp.]
MEPPRSLPAPLDGVRLRDAIDLMAWPCFALTKGPRHVPIIHEHRGDFMRVSSLPGARGLATIWDADILTWAVSQLAEARDRRLHVSPALLTSGFQVLRFLGRGTGRSQYALLTAALERLAGTHVETSIGAALSAPARFHWIERWEHGNAGLIIVVPDWLLATVTERRRVLRVPPAYLRLTGAIERWLWRLLCRHAHGISTSWKIPLATLHARSGSLARATDFVVELRKIARRNVLPGYTLSIVWRDGEECLHAVRSAESFHSAAAVPGDRPAFYPQNRGVRL